MMQANYCRQ